VVQQIWGRFNANERISGYGAGILIVVSLIGFALGWSGPSTFGLLAGVIVLGIYYAKYAPNMHVTWPAPVATIVLAVGGIALILLVLQLLPQLRYIAGADALVIIGLPVGAALVAWGAWQEYQAARPAAPPPGAPPPAPPAPPAG